MLNKTDYSDSSYSSPKKRRHIEPQEEFSHSFVRLPKVDPNDKGPKIEYDDGLSPRHIDRLRKESTNRIKARKLKEQEYKKMIKLRNSRYGGSISLSGNHIPDFEVQLPTAFNLKNRRADALGVRNLIIDENELTRASRPNMDRLVVIEKLKHEVKDFSIRNDIQRPENAILKLGKILY